jgi:hypothetical protein
MFLFFLLFLLFLLFLFFLFFLFSVVFLFISLLFFLLQGVYFLVHHIDVEFGPISVRFLSMVVLCFSIANLSSVGIGFLPDFVWGGVIDFWFVKFGEL